MFVFICVVIFTLFVLLKIEPNKNIASQAEKTYISDEDLEYKRNVERLKNEELFKQVLPVIEALNKKEKTLQELLTDIDEKLGLTVQQYQNLPDAEKANYKAQAKEMTESGNGLETTIKREDIRYFKKEGLSVAYRKPFAAGDVVEFTT